MSDWLSILGPNNSAEAVILAKTILRIVLIIFVALVLKKISKRAVRLLKSKLSEQSVADSEEIKRIDTLSMVVSYIITILIISIAAVEILHELGISIAPVLAAAGVVGLAIGFGAQSLVKDYFNGFFLLLENQIRKGDVVQISDKSGLVEEVTLRYIKMRDYEGNVHYVPNGIITTVTNMSRGFAHAVIDVGVAYKEDITKVISVMEKVGTTMFEDAQFQNKILDKLEMAGVDNLADSAVIIRCRFKVAPLEQWGVRREYLKRIKAAFDHDNIEIPFPHLTVFAGSNNLNLK
jgi:moderate conductance mechanosensitive channel